MSDVLQAGKVLEALRKRPGLLFEVLRQGRSPQIAGPWVDAGDDRHLIRLNTDGSWAIWVRREESGTWEYSVLGYPTVGGFVARETAMKEADKELLAGDWVLP